MKTAKSRRGNAYILVVLVAMLVLALGLTVLTVTAASRRASARYQYFFGAYDIAVAGQEQALFVIQEGLLEHRESAHEHAIPQVVEHVLANPEAHLVFYEGQFHLYPPTLYVNAFAEEVSAALWTEIAMNFPLHEAVHQRSIELTINIETDDLTTQDRYALTTSIIPAGFEFLLRTDITKYTGATFRQAAVEASVVWPEFTLGEIFVPTFTWGITRPDRFDHALHPFAPLDEWLDFSRLDELQMVDDPAIIFLPSETTFVDIASLPQPAIIIHLGAGANFNLFSSDPWMDTFNGIIIAAGDISFSLASFYGSAWAGGSIITDLFFEATPDANVIFSLPRPEQKILFDFLRITDFANSTNISCVLGYLAIYDGEVQIKNLDDYTPAMVQLWRVEP